MADVTKKVAVELVLEGQRELEEDLRKTTAQMKQQGGVDQQLRKTVLRNEKEREKIDKKINDPRKKKQGTAALKSAVDLEKQKLKVIQKQNAALDAQLRRLRNAAGISERMGRGGRRGPGGPGGYDDDPRRGRGRFARMGVFGALGAGVLGVGGAMLGTVTSQIGQGYGQYSQYGQALAGLMGTGTGYGQAGDISARGRALGYSQIESARQARAAAIATGQAGAVGQAQMVSRGTTLDMGAITGIMAQLTQVGAGFGGAAGGQGKRELQNVIALGFRAGIDKARLPEYMKGVTQVVAAQAGRQGRDVDATQYATMLRAMGAFGGTGMQGARGAAVFQRLNEAIVRPGGGEAGQALMLQAMGFGRPGGDTSYYEARRRQEQGATPENVRRLFAELGGQRGGGEAMRLAMQEMTGLGLTQIEELQQVVERLSGTRQQAELERILKEAKPPEERAVDEMQELGEIAEQHARITNHLVTIGEDNKDAIIDIQNAINDMVKIWMPAAVESLKIIANIMRGIANFMGANVPAEPGETTLTGARGRAASGGEGTLMGNVSGITNPLWLGATKALSQQERNAMEQVLKKNAEAFNTFSAAAQSSTKKDDAAFMAMFKPGGAFHAMFQEELSKMNNAANRSADAAEIMANAAKEGPAATKAQPIIGATVVSAGMNK